MTSARFLVRATVLAASLAAGVPAARADAIDGNWCSADGRHFAISGPTIVTEDGLRVEGRYSRHAFAYTVPEPNKAAGRLVQMVLRNEVTLNLQVGGVADAPIEVWRRCEITS
jgi:hypothetical protein